MNTLFLAVLTFGIPAILSHFGVAAIATRLLTKTFGSSAASAAGGVVSNQIGSLLKHIATGGEITQEHRDWLARQQGVPTFTPPKFDSSPPPDPVSWEPPKQ